MRYASVCDGIGAAHAAWSSLGWECAWHAEIDDFPAAVVEARCDAGPNLGDIAAITDEELEAHGATDLLVGGTPCQSFSVAGLRGGLDDPRGNLALVFLGLAARTRSRWVVWENVPGVLSSNDGRDFGAFLGGLVELGYGFAYRVLDAQYIRVDSHPRAVPQRRRRVFVVGCLGDWRRAASVLLERASLRGDLAPRREAGAGVAALTARGVGTCGADDNQAQAGHLVAHNGSWGQPNGGGVARPLNAPRQGSGGGYRCDLGTETLVAHSLRAEGFDASEDGTGRGTPLVACHESGQGWWNEDEIAGTLRADGENRPSRPSRPSNVVAFQPRIGRNGRGFADDGSVHALNGADAGATSDMRPCVAFHATQDPIHARERSPALSGTAYIGVSDAVTVRRLTPLECERLQGFPDGWTDIPWKGKRAPDGRRYRALGNSMAVNVMRWIGQRIKLVEAVRS